MTDSDSTRTQRYRDKQISKIGLVAYKKHRAKIARERRARKKAQLVPIEIKHNDIETEFIKNSIAIERVVTDSTRKQYFARLNSLHNGMYGGDMVNLDWTEDVDSVLEFISDNFDTAGTKQNYIVALTSVLRRFTQYGLAYRKYAEFSDREVKDYNDNREDNLLSEDEMKLIIHWSEIKKIKVQQLVMSKLHKIIIRLYQEIPRRSNTIGILQWRLRESNYGNYLIIRGSDLFIVLQEYKTFKSYGKQEYQLSVLLSKMVQSYVRKQRVLDGDYIFKQVRDNKPIPRTQFIKLLSDTTERAYGVRFSSRLWRISKASYISKKNISVKDKTSEALRLGHSLNQMMLYNKLNL